MCSGFSGLGVGRGQQGSQGWQCGDQRIHLGAGGAAAQRQADGAQRLVFGHAHGSQHRRRLAARGRAGCPRGRREAQALQPLQQHVGRPVPHAQEAHARQAGYVGAPDVHLGQRGSQGTLQPVTQRRLPRSFGIHIAQLVQRRRHAGDRGQVLGAAAAVTFLRARHRRADHHTLAQQQRARALGAVQLMGREGHRISAAVRKMKRPLADPLRRVDMQARASRRRERRDLRYGHHDAGFVVGRHHRDQGHVPTYEVGSCVQVQSAIWLHRQEIHRHSGAHQFTRQLQVAGMLDRAEQHATPFGRRRRQQPANCEMIGLGRAAGEDHLGWLAA